MTKFISNAFSLQMLETDATLSVREVDPAQLDLNSYTSVVGHADTARVLGVDCNRASVTLNKGDSLLVAQLMGGRLPEGATTLPENSKFRFMLVDII